MTKGPSMSGGPAIGFRGKAPTKSTPVKTGNRNGYATRPSGSSATSGVPKTDPHSTRSRASSIGKRGPAASKGTSTQPKLKKEGSVFKFAKKVSKKVRGFSDRMDNNVRDPLRAKMGLPKAGGAKKSKPNTRRSKQRGGKR